MTDYPKVSVVTITYGHENYITQTLDGVLMQDYPGEIEFIIANDHSPDATGEIIKDYLSSKTIPDNFIVKYTKHEVNKGMMPNFIWALEEASGKYVALCEGDDYWTDPQKLQKQVDFLQANEDYVLCFTNRDILRENCLELGRSLSDKSSFNKSEIPYLHVPTLTVVFRKVEKKIPLKIYPTLMDASLFLFLSQFGSFFYIDERMATYRIHEKGIYGGASNVFKHTTSVNARISAWRYLEQVDKVALADVLIYWIRLRKRAELKSKMYISALMSSGKEYFFVIYLLYRRFSS